MLKTICLPPLASAVTLAVWLVTLAMMGSNQVAAQGIRIQFGSNPSGYYSGYYGSEYGSGYYGSGYGTGYGSGYYGTGYGSGSYGSGYGTGYAAPSTSYGYSSGYRGYGYGLSGYRSSSLYTYPSTSLYNFGYSASPYPYSPSIQLQGRAFGQNYNRFRGYNSYSPYGFRGH